MRFRQLTARAILGSDDYVILKSGMGNPNGFTVSYVKDKDGNMYKVKGQFSKTRKELDLRDLEVEVKLIFDEPEGRWENIGDLVSWYHSV